MNEFRERLMFALGVAKMTRKQFAKEVGVSTATVSQWTVGKAQNMLASTAAKIEALTSIRVAWLMTGEGPRFIHESTGLGTPIGGGRIVPLITAERAETWASNPDPYQDTKTPQWVVSDKDLPPASFALDITDDAMAPLFHHGERVIIAPAQQLAPGVFVLALISGQGVALRKYRPRAIGTESPQSFELVALNDDYPLIRSDEVDIKLLGVVAEHRRYMSA